MTEQEIDEIKQGAIASGDPVFAFRMGVMLGKLDRCDAVMDRLTAEYYSNDASADAQTDNELKPTTYEDASHGK